MVRPSFHLICIDCHALGIVLDHAANAPSSTLIKCRHCGAPRGTLGDLRSLAQSTRHDLFETTKQS
jgi:hypothetical protein